MNTSSFLKQVLHWGGSGLAMIGIGFVIFRLRSYGGDIAIENIRPLTACFIAIMAAIYGANNFFLALAWWHLLEFLGVDLAYLSAIRIYGISQLAKYVPGNIFHLAGRQALGMAAGISGSVLVKSSLWELGLIAISGSLFGWLILPLIVNHFHVLVSIFLLVVSSAFISVILAYLTGHHTIWAFTYQISFLIISASIFVSLLDIMIPNLTLTLAQDLSVGSAYLIAWLIGLLTPGAPAGVGVRELVLLFLLKGFVNEADLLMVILLGRLVTVTGDLFLFVMAIITPKKISNKEKTYA